MTEGARPDKGVLFEARVARLIANEGAFVRRRVPLEPHYGEKFAVTDLDVLAITFDRTLTRSVAVVECKATEARNAASAADRLLWLVGLRALVTADRSALYVTKPAGDALRRLASDLGSAIADERDIARREQRLGLTDPATRSGSSHPAVLSAPEDARRALKAEPDLLRAYWFARSDLWLASPASVVKRALGACRIVANHYSPRLPAHEEAGLRWLAGELFTGVVLAVVHLASEAYHLPEQMFAERMQERLAEGLADQRSLEQLSKAVDEYLVGVLREAGASPAVVVGSLGAFVPRAPAYAERLVELVVRFAEVPRAAADAPRICDELFAAGLRGGPAEGVTAEDAAETLRLVRLVAAFVGRQARMASELLSPVTDPVAASVSSSASDPALPDPQPVTRPERTLFDGS